MSSSRETDSAEAGDSIQEKGEQKSAVGADAGNTSAAATSTGVRLKQGKSTRGGKKKNADTEGDNAPRRWSRRLQGKAKKAADAAMTGEEHLVQHKLYVEAVEAIELNYILSDELIRQTSGCSTEASYATVHLRNDKPPIPHEPEVSNLPESLSLTCEKCSKIFTTNNGFLKHTLSHKIKEANSRRPDVDTLYPHANDIVTRSLSEIAEEYGEEKKRFVEGLLDARENKVNDWKTFIEILSGPFMNNVTKVSSITPSAQYEEQLVKMNKILNNEDTMDAVLNCLKSLSNNLSIFESCIPRMVVFRLSSKLVDELLVLVFEQMQGASLEEPDNHSFDMSDVEVQAFGLHIRKLLLEYYKKCLKIESNVSLARCACIRECFVSTDNDEPTSVYMMLQNSSWTKDESGKAQLRLNSEVIGFFVRVEHIIQSLLHRNERVNCDAIMDVIFKPENSPMLNSWSSLTALFFFEEDALIFLRDILSIVTHFSLKLEVGKIMSTMSKDKVQKYALRTDLKRN